MNSNMKLLKNLGFSTNGSSDNAAHSADTQNSPGISQELFVDSTPPVKQARTADEMNEFLEYLSSNFFGNGFRDGYENQDHQYLSLNEERIRNEAALKAQLVIEQKKEKVLALKTLLIDIGTTSREESEIAKANIEQQDKSILELEKEINHAIGTGKVLEEGLVMRAISEYRAGFRKGIRAYAEEKLFGRSTNMFN